MDSNDIVLYAQWQIIIDTDLKDLSVMGYDFDQPFDAQITHYTVSNVTGAAVEVMAVVDSNQYNRVTVDGVSVTSGAAVRVDLVNGTNICDVVVTSQDDVTSKTYSITFNKLSDTANLKTFEIKGYELTPSFDQTTTSYGLHMTSGAAVTLVIEPEEVGSTIDLGGYTASEVTTSGAVVVLPVAVGRNVYEFKVTAENKIDQKIYVLTIDRDNNKPEPQNIEILGQTSLIFRSDVMTYSIANTLNDALDLRVTMDEYDAIKINGAAMASGEICHVPLSFGNNVIRVITTAEDGIHSKTYTFNVYRVQNTALLSGLKLMGSSLSTPFSPTDFEYTLNGTQGHLIQLIPRIDEATKASIKIDGTSVGSGRTFSKGLVLGENVIEVVVVAEDGTTVVYQFKINRYRESSGGGSDSGSSDSGSGLSNQDTSVSKPSTSKEDVKVLVNGKSEIAGVQSKQKIDGRSVLTVKTNPELIEEKIAIAKVDGLIENTVVVPVSGTGSDAVEVLLTGDVVKTMENGDFKLTVDVGNVQYVIPAKQVQISSVADQLGVPHNQLEAIVVTVEIESVADHMEAQIYKDAATQKYQVVCSPLAFKVKATVDKSDHTQETIEINRFSQYVVRRVEIAEAIDVSDITTGVLYNPDGTFSHIPTTVVKMDGRYYAELHSMTNSCYSIIYNPIEIPSVEGYLFEDSVNNLASRLIIDNIEKFEPNAPITRGDFIEYLVKAIGLYKTNRTSDSVFSDGSLEYADVIDIAKSYHLVTGYPDGTIRENNQITREEALVLLSNVQKILESDEGDRDVVIEKVDEISPWAEDSVQRVLNSKIIDNPSQFLTHPQSILTYGESAVVIERLLMHGELINR
jgi:hypothetical protein